jgi:hypothetical protein
MNQEFRSVFMPYCLILNPSGKYTITNRNYKPLGMWGKFVNYEDYAVSINGLDPKKIAALSYKADPSPDRIFLYNDGSVPTASKKNMDEYLARLDMLSKLSITI